ncbi:GH25 family lysozyme M1 (1,4-beta-N-acetylmuramidase) [Psychromicrobium silvestre]|uniref:Lysozyme n=1 Tax=Psychromicrobium silvestre TaxID=1645614 RepID=A0A7Y9LVK0_9MICC|nr:lysozyme [Psychromicrobium silvestre]NYE96415.1 GH25 family lysozyme M1 (1,4-beta-N-acetylmuramidase) [Psychromicrobium silvestre]
MFKLSKFRTLSIAAPIALSLGLVAASALPAQAAPTGPPGIDVASHQGNVDWNAVKAAGVQWAYVKATEGNYYQNPYFAQQYNGAYDVGLIRGAYTFATPNDSSGANQANYLVDHGGGWSADNKTLPPMLDIEANPYGATCYGLSQSAMVSWLHDFVNTIHTRTGRYPTIYTATSWWTQCTGNSAEFDDSALFIASWSSTPGTLPASWSYTTFWQYADSGPLPPGGDQDLFNGSSAGLLAYANGHP